MEILSPTISTLPSVSPQDIRLTYARIFMDAFNNFEKASLRDQLHSFCTKDCVLTVKWTGPLGNPCGPHSRVVSGIDVVLSFIDVIMFQ